MLPADRNPALAWARGAVEGLVSSGVHHLCMSPGARSAPLVFAAAERSALETSVHHDERVAGFFALGLARASGRPVALLCTSGSAAAHWLPAVIEASMSGVPLVLLSADRPPSLRDCGANQAIDQHGLFGRYVRWFHDPGVPPDDPDACARIRRVLERAVTVSLGPVPGPVHVNLPFEEPLVPLAADGWPLVLAEDASVDELSAPAPGPPPRAALERARAAISTASRVVVICGASPLTAFERAAARTLADACDAPLLADPTSGMRWPDDERVWWTADTVLSDEEAAERLAPDAFIRFGAMPTSKPVLRWMTRLPDVPRVVFDPHGAWREPTWGRSVVVPGDAAIAANELASDERPGGARSLWRQRVERAHEAAMGIVADPAVLPEEGAVAAAVVRSLADRDVLQVASSMPIRDLDAVGRPDHRELTVFSNRGANGIDGTIATGLGAGAWATRRGSRVTVVLGDVAALHDVGGFAAALASPVDATVVVVNNDGGGIFGFLPVASFGDVFERAFATPHARNFRAVAAMYDLGYELVDDVTGLDAALGRARAARGVTVVEVITDRVRNVAAWRELRRRVAAAVSASLSGGDVGVS